MCAALREPPGHALPGNVAALLLAFAIGLLPQFAMMMIYLVMALALIFRPSGLLPARRFSTPG